MELENKPSTDPKSKSNIEDDDFSIPLEEQLDNANTQIKDLQDYIKQKSLDDIKNNQIRQENFQKNEKAHQERYKSIKK